jgi:hypothetical protein
MPKIPVDLKVLNKLVKALNDQVSHIESVVDDKAACSDEQFTVEVAKAMGIASGVALEATAIVGDFTRGFSTVAAPKKMNPDDILNQLFGGKPVKN